MNNRARMNRSWPNFAGQVALVAALVAGNAVALAQVEFPPLGPIRVMNTTALIDTGDDTDLRIGNDGAGNLVAVWVSNDSAEGLLGDDLDLAVASSADGGATWSVPAPLNSDAGTDTADDSNAEIATDGNGNWVVVWHAEGTGSTTSTDIRVANSTDNGATWSDPAPLVHALENINRAGADSDPHIAADGEGKFIVVWTSTRDIDGDLEPEPDEDDRDVPRVTTDTDIFFAISADGGATWSDAAPFNSDHLEDDLADDEPSIATDLAGTWMVVWGGAGQLSYSRSENGGATWTPAAIIPGAAGTGPMLVNDHARAATETTAWFAVWQGAGISVSRYLESDLGDLELPEGEEFDEWLAPILVSPSGGLTGVANDAIGRWVVSWTDGAPMAALSINVGREWTPPTPIDASGDPTGTNPQATAVGDNDWLMLWSSAQDVDGAGTDLDILASDFTFGIFNDCNGNGINDSDDIADGVSEDCNANGIPDDCTDLEADNDGDGIIDACDDTPFGDVGGEGEGEGDGEGEGEGDGEGEQGGGGGGGGGGGSPCAFGMVGGIPGILLGMFWFKAGGLRKRRHRNRPGRS